jgi:hypothetical protein
MSKPIQGDIVLTLDRNGTVHPAIVLDVGAASIDIGSWFIQPGTPPSALLDYIQGATEVPDVASLTAGTWCRREVCG